VNSEGLPWWWLNRYFGIMPTSGMGGSGASGFAMIDSDGDGLTNYEEYRTVTDPTDPGDVFVAIIDPDLGAGTRIKWKSGNNRTYTLLRASSLTSGFVAVDKNIIATPPENTYEDTSISGPGPFYYRVVVE
jgi:hypothetical protein